MHRVRWILTIGWFLLIFLLFYDPWTEWFTIPGNMFSILALDPTLDPNVCVQRQGVCMVEYPYAIGPRFFWAAVVPSAIFILLVLGHECWRRICPLGFLSQLPRALGWQRHRLKVNQSTGLTRKELVKVDKDSWLGRNHLWLQFGFFYLGLCIRLLFVNSDSIALGIFLLLTIASALTVGYLFSGKSWCQYFCPMAPVQKIYSEPRALLNSTAHIGEKQKITQSMCREVGQDGKEKAACVACQAPCVDIDAERTYWELITRPDQRWLHYAYFGITVGFYVYFYLYAGNWDYYYSGAWTHEEDQLSNLLKPGFYIADHAIPIPKLFAVPLTLGLFCLGGYWIGVQLEKQLKAFFLRRKRAVSLELIRHKMFTLCTFLVFNVFFMFGGRPTINLLPEPVQYTFTMLIAVTSSLWLYRTWERSPAMYQRESLATRLRKQLHKMNLDVGKFLAGRSLDNLTADEVYVLAKILPDFSQTKRLQMYKGILREAIDDGYVDPINSLENFQQMRQELSISEQDHETCLTELMQEYPELFNPNHRRSREESLRLTSYRENLIEAILSAWNEQPGRLEELMKAFSEDTSPEAVEKILNTLSPENRAAIQTIRQNYGISAEDEVDALRHTEPQQLWQSIAERTGLSNYLKSGGEAELQRIFQEIDTDGSGAISLTELEEYVQKIDPNIAIAQVASMLACADENHDNQVSYEEFQNFCKLLAKHTRP